VRLLVLPDPAMMLSTPCLSCMERRLDRLDLFSKQRVHSRQACLPWLRVFRWKQVRRRATRGCELYNSLLFQAPAEGACVRRQAPDCLARAA